MSLKNGFVKRRDLRALRNISLLPYGAVKSALGIVLAIPLPPLVGGLALVGGIASLNKQGAWDWRGHTQFSL